MMGSLFIKNCRLKGFSRPFLAILFLFMFFTSSLSFSQEGEFKDETLLRKFFYHVVEASGKKSSKDKVKAMKKAFADHPEVLKWVLEGKDIAKIVQNADLPNIPPSIINHLKSMQTIGQNLRTANEALLRIEGLIPNFQDMDRLTPATIIKYILRVSPTMAMSNLSGLGKKALISVLLIESEKRLKKRILSMSRKEKEKLLDLVPNNAYLSIVDKINSTIDKAKFSDSAAIKMMQNPQTGFDMSQAPKKLANLFNSVILGYFDQLHIDDKRKMVLGLLELPVGSSDAKKLSSILNNAGPVLQKLFQLFGKDVKSPLVAEVMTELKSNIRPFDSNLAKNIIEKNYKKSINQLFSSFRDKPLAAASVGQVHLAKLKGSDQEVVIKVLRPGIEEKAKREIATLKRLAPDEGSKKIISQLEESVLEELDFRIEGENLEEGQAYLNPGKGIIPITVVEELPVTKDVMAMKKAPGKTIDKFTDNDLYPKGEALSTFLELWFDKALFDDGFFHADLHAGNIFFKPLDPETDDKEDIHPDLDTDYVLTPIDFGSASRLSHQEQKGILKLALGAIFKSPKTIMSSYASFYQMNEREEEEFSKYINDLMKNEQLSAFEVINLTLNKAIEMEFEIPKNFIMFNRGRMFLEKQISELNEQLEEYDPYETLPRYDVHSIYRNVVIKRLTADFVKSFLGLQDDEDAYLDDETIANLVDEYFAPKAKELATKAAKCTAKGAFYLTYSFLEQMNDFLRFLDPLPYDQYNSY